MFIWGGILSNIRLEITVYGYSYASTLNLILDHLSDNIPLEMKMFNTVIS